jgi:hypothetical protein
MKKLMALALLATVPGLLPAQAQAQTSWTGSTLSISGDHSNGCNLHVVEVTHSGSTLSSLRFMMMNLGNREVRVNAEVTITGNNQRKSGPIFGEIGPSRAATLQGFHPFGGSLAGSTVDIRFSHCTAR